MANTPKQPEPRTSSEELDTERSAPLVFRPQVAELELEELLTQLVERANQVLSSYETDASYDERTQLVAGFAAQAAVALELAQARKYQEQLFVLASREDLIRELNDRVVSRLFAAGLQMHHLAAGMADADQAARVASVVGELDLAIRDIREAVFHLNF
jgi:nitrate/nitrite-specific signal transduction histidine kinase